MHRIFTEIHKFKSWADEYSNTPENERSGEWECSYDNWQDIYDQFSDFLENIPVKNWTSEIKDKLLYIIARDNEMEILSDMLHGKALIDLAEHSLQHGSRDAKWQLAVKLSRLIDKSKAAELLEAYVNDQEEYVNRRALTELAKFEPEKAESYCEKFWKRNLYEEDEDEYQKITVLRTLEYLQSPLLAYYLAIARADRRKYLRDCAEEIEERQKLSPS